MSEFRKDIPLDNITKAKIRGCVEAYIKLFPEEFALVKSQVNKKRWLLDDTEFGQSKMDSIVYRALFEIPESLEAIIIKGLTESELVQFRGLKGARWFANTFKEFRTANQV